MLKLMDVAVNRKIEQVGPTTCLNTLSNWRTKCFETFFTFQFLMTVVICCVFIQKGSN